MHYARLLPLLVFLLLPNLLHAQSSSNSAPPAALRWATGVANAFDAHVRGEGFVTRVERGAVSERTINRRLIFTLLGASESEDPRVCRGDALIAAVQIRDIIQARGIDAFGVVNLLCADGSHVGVTSDFRRIITLEQTDTSGTYMIDRTVSLH